MALVGRALRFFIDIRRSLVGAWVTPMSTLDYEFRPWCPGRLQMIFSKRVAFSIRDNFQKDATSSFSHDSNNQTCRRVLNSSSVAKASLSGLKIFFMKNAKSYNYIFISWPKLSFDNTLSLGRVKSIDKETENMHSSEKLGGKSSLKALASRWRCLP